MKKVDKLKRDIKFLRDESREQDTGSDGINKNISKLQHRIKRMKNEGSKDSSKFPDFE